MTSSGSAEWRPGVSLLGDTILHVDYRRCNMLKAASIDSVNERVLALDCGTGPFSMLVDLRGTRSYRIGLQDLIGIKRSYTVSRAAWIVEGRIANMLKRMLDMGNIFKHRIALFDDYDEALAWLQGFDG